MTYAKKIKVYEKFGFIATANTTTQIIGTCLFCNKDKHFFIHKEKALFDCKKCGVQGSCEDFLSLIYEDLKKERDIQGIRRLADYRRIPIEAYDETDIICIDHQYLIPIRNRYGKIQDIRTYVLGKNIYSTEGAELGIFNLKDLLDESKKHLPVYICEGEHDAIALIYLFKKVNFEAVVVGIPGANTLKKEWYDWFNGKDLIYCYDNDGAGEGGYEKGKEKLNGYKSIHKIIWPDGTPKGFDVNEFISVYGVSNHKYNECYNVFRALIRDEANVSIVVKEHLTNKLPEHVSFEELLKEYKKTLEINPEYENAIRVMLATILSVNISGNNPLWLFFVGPPSSGKTAILDTTRSCNLCYYQSSLSRHMLISGWKTPNGTDPSILGKLNKKCFILKDFTEVLFKSGNDRDEIFGVLRGAFDGHVEREFGNGISRRYPSLFFSMLAGVTQEINSFPQASAGDRFLRYNFSYDAANIEKQQRMALTKAIHGDNDRAELQLWVSRFLMQKFDFSPEKVHSFITPQFYNKIIPLARLVAYLRTPVVRYERGRKNELPVYEPIAETGNRIALQLQRLAISLAILEKKDDITDSIYQILKKVAFDTVESYSTRIITILYKEGVALSKKQLINRLDLNNDIIPYLEDLQLLNMVNSKITSVNGTNTLNYYLSDNIFELYSRVEHGV